MRRKRSRIILTKGEYKQLDEGPTEEAHEALMRTIREAEEAGFRMLEDGFWIGIKRKEEEDEGISRP